MLSFCVAVVSKLAAMWHPRAATLWPLGRRRRGGQREPVSGGAADGGGRGDGAVLCQCAESAGLDGHAPFAGDRRGNEESALHEEQIASGAEYVFGAGDAAAYCEIGVRFVAGRGGRQWARADLAVLAHGWGTDGEREGAGQMQPSCGQVSRVLEQGSLGAADGFNDGLHIGARAALQRADVETGAGAMARCSSCLDQVSICTPASCAVRIHDCRQLSRWRAPCRIR